MSIIISEGIGRNNIQEAINDIAKEAEKLDFENHEILLVPTFERITSLRHLEQRLMKIKTKFIIV